MRKRGVSKNYFVIGLVLAVASLYLAFTGVHYWYFLGGIGVWFVFDYIASIKDRNTALQILRRDKKEFFHLYMIMFFAGATIEFVGRGIFDLWFYTTLQDPLLELANLVVWPFLFFSFREMYVSINNALRIPGLSLIIAVYFGIVFWELPNMVSLDWFYVIPGVDFEVFGLNIVVVAGWFILIWLPVYVYDQMCSLR